MIDTLVAHCLARRGIVWLVFIGVAMYGAFCWTQLPLEAYPDIADTTSQVVTQVPGLAAEEVEKQITIPLEREIMGTPGMAVMRSKSTFGLSLITVVFQDGAEDYWSRQRLTERINGVTLPYNAQPGLDALTSPIGEIYRYTLESKTRDLREHSELQFWTVIPRLKQVPGLADVSNFGGLTTQFLVEFDPDKLVKYHVSLGQVTQAINANNASAGGSVLVRGEQGFVVRGVGLLGGLDDLGNVVVTEKGGVPVLVRDLGEIKLGERERHGILGKNDDPDTIEGIVLLQKGENPSRVLDAVHAAVDDLNQHILPRDVKIVPYLDRATLVRATVHTVGRTLAEGVLLVTVVLLLFLGSPRAALIVALTIPLALLVAFICMHQFKVPANLLSLGAIDFGIVVDASIVVMENILRRREEQPDRPLSARDVLEATLQVTRPIFFGMVVIITAYTPLFAFQRIEYKLFSPMAYAVGFALLGALAVALTLIPGLALVAWRRPRPIFHNPVLERLGALYARLLERVVGTTALTAAAYALAFAGLVAFGATIGRDFLPYLDEGSLWLQVTLPPGISFDKASSMAGDLRRAALEFKEVDSIVTQLGRNDDGTDPFTPSHIESSVVLHPQAGWASGWDKQELIRHMAARFARLPGTDVGFTQPMIDGVLDKLAGAHSDLVVKVYGNDLHETRRIASDAVRVLKKIEGAADVTLDQEPPLPQLRIAIDRAAAARYGINVADIAELIGTGIGGAPVAQLYVDERRYDIAVRAAPAARDDPDAIGRLMLTAPRWPAHRPRAGRPHRPGRRREHHHPRDGPAPPDRAPEPARPRPGVVPGGRAPRGRGAGSLRPRARAPRVGRPVREPAAGPGAPRADPADGAGADVRAALRPVQEPVATDHDPAGGAAGRTRRPGRAVPARHDLERVERGRLHRALRGRGDERHHHGDAPQPPARGRWVAAARGGDPRGAGTLPAGLDDRHRRRARAAAGGAGARLGQRRATAAGDRRGRRPGDGDPG